MNRQLVLPVSTISQWCVRRSSMAVIHLRPVGEGEIGGYPQRGVFIELADQMEQQGGQALLHGTRLDGEPQRPCGRRLFDAGQWTRRADCGAAYDRAARPTNTASNATWPPTASTPRISSTNCGLRTSWRAHVAQNTSGRSSAIDGRMTRHAGYAVSQRVRKRIEEAFGWIKTIAGQEKTKLRGRERVGWAFTFAAAAYNLARLPKLIAEPT